MIASFETTLFGRMTKLPALRAQLGRAPGDLGDAPFVLADPDPVPDVERLLALDREAGEGVAERVLQREAEHDRADRRGREQLLAEERRREQDQPDDDRSPGGWSGSRSGTRSTRSGLIEEDDRGVDQRGGERELCESRRSCGRRLRREVMAIEQPAARRWRRRRRAGRARAGACA